MKNWFTLSNRSRRKKYKVAATICMFFSFFCFITAFVISWNAETIKKTLSTSEESLVGPFEAPKDNTVFQIDVEHLVWDPQWSFLTFELLDEKKETVLSFDNEFWYASGGSGEDAWSEGLKSFDTKITVRKKGKYYLAVSSENNFGKNTHVIKLRISRQLGSNLPFILLGIATFILSLFIAIVASNLSDSYKPDADPVKIHRSGLVFISVILVLIGTTFALSLLFSTRGWGYTGYYGYNRPSVFFYPDGTYYHYNSPSLRHGSLGGPSHRGGGIKGGK